MVATLKAGLRAANAVAAAATAEVAEAQNQNREAAVKIEQARKATGQQKNISRIEEQHP